ncbi:MAG: fumarylacetoacetate hydrolase family protein [Steroidobacteraceae bacterium]
MQNLAFAVPPRPVVPVAGASTLFPVHRIYCVGKNYAAHAREMGTDPTREPPFFFSKPADALVGDGARVAYPSRTANFHHEIELVVAIGGEGREVTREAALGLVYGYAVGNDFTRRDLQARAKDKGQPWDVAKGFDESAAISAIRSVSQVGHPQRGRIWLAVNGTVRQDADISELTWSVPEIIAELSTLFTLRPGDLIYTGTPAGVGALHRGDRIEGGVEGVGSLSNEIA